MKPFRLTKNHNETGVFTKDDEIVGNAQINQNVQANDNQINFEPNQNHIHINLVNNPRAIGEFEKGFDNTNSVNNLEMDNDIID